MQKISEMKHEHLTTAKCQISKILPKLCQAFVKMQNNAQNTKDIQNADNAENDENVQNLKNAENF